MHSIGQGKSSGALEKSSLTVGYVPLTDCLPLVVAAETGLFTRHGLDVVLQREPSWSNIRDKVSYGLLDAAQMPAGIALAATARIGGSTTRMCTALSLGLNGNSITVSAALYARMVAVDPGLTSDRKRSAAALSTVLKEDRAAGRPLPVFAVVFSVASHAYLLRYWLASGGIDPDRDVRIVVVPPPAMVASMQRGDIAGFCVGDPWNTLAVSMGLGATAITGYELWNNAPDKVLGVTVAWAEQHPNTHRALVAALLQAATWLDRAENRGEAAAMLARPDYAGVAVETLAISLGGKVLVRPGQPAVPMPDMHVFHRYAANFPWRSHALWTLSQMVRWGQLPSATDLQAIAASTYRPDIYRGAAATAGLSAPAEDMKTEGEHDGAWWLATQGPPLAMGADRFVDGRRFDPDRPLDYAREAALHAIDASEPHSSAA